MAGSGAIVRQGHLRKLKTMRKKYFVLRAECGDASARLEYYESEKKFRSGAAPRRMLLLKNCYNITRRLDLKQKHVIALFTREEQLCIVAENEQDLHAWLAAILKQHRSDDASQELLHPIQHVWQVNVQKKGLGASKNIQGLYNLCLTDKTLTLVKIKSHNNIISDLGIPERVEYALKNIRRCGDSECFFYMEVGRQTATGSGELWMHSDDSNIAQSMHSTILHAMRNCAKETENEKDHIVIPNKGSLEGAHVPQARRQTLPGDRGRVAPYSDAGQPRNRCDSMPSRSSYESERPPPRHVDLAGLAGLDSSRDDIDSVEWYGTPRIPEEPDSCDIISKDFMNVLSSSMAAAAAAHGGGGGGGGGGGSAGNSRTSSCGADDADAEPARGYVPMAPRHGDHGTLVSSSGSVYSGTPSTDPRFSEYQLEPAISHITEERSARAYSVGSRPGPRTEPLGRTRAYSAGARRHTPAAPSSAPAHAHAHTHSHAHAADHMELDFSANSPSPKVTVARTPPAAGFADLRRVNVDEYVDMSPRNAGYVDMRPGESAPAAPAPAPTPAAPATPDGYVEMSYGRAPTRPINIAAPRAPPPAPASSSPDDTRRRRQPRTPLGSQTIFPISLDSPASPPELDTTDFEEDPPHHALTTVREISEDGKRSPEGKHSPDVFRRSPDRTPEMVTPESRTDVSCSPQYVKLVRAGVPVAKLPDEGDLCSNPTANKMIVRPPELTDSRGSPGGGGGVGVGSLHYAALDLEPRRPPAAPAVSLYTQIDFRRSEQMQADAT